METLFKVKEVGNGKEYWYRIEGFTGKFKIVFVSKAAVRS